jgi:hypothetical protein
VIFPDLRDGKCVTPDGRYLDVMMPDGDGNHVDRARRVCKGCPVKEACLEWALRHEQFGVWGGTSESERKQLRRRRGIVYQQLGLLYGTSRRRAS